MRIAGLQHPGSFNFEILLSERLSPSALKVEHFERGECKSCLASNLIERSDQFSNTNRYRAYTLAYTICTPGTRIVEHRELIAPAAEDGQRFIDDVRK
jgi:hypothetical protein